MIQMEAERRRCEAGVQQGIENALRSCMYVCLFVWYVFQGYLPIYTFLDANSKRWRPISKKDKNRFQKPEVQFQKDKDHFQIGISKIAKTYKMVRVHIQGVRAKFDTSCFHDISELLQDIDIG